jgi:hypothetical protein
MQFKTQHLSRFNNVLSCRGKKEGGESLDLVTTKKKKKKLQLQLSSFLAHRIHECSYHNVLTAMNDNNQLNTIHDNNNNNKITFKFIVKYIESNKFNCKPISILHWLFEHTSLVLLLGISLKLSYHPTAGIVGSQVDFFGLYDQLQYQRKLNA